MTDTKTYHWGRTAELRARRDWLGLSAGDMAEQLGMSRRSYQRMERGDEAIPAGLWDTVQAVDDRMDAAVDAVVTAAHAARETEARTLELRVFPDDSTWDRQVLARAVHARTWIRPKFDDDYRAVIEMENDNGPDQVPEPNRGG